jgi:methyl-accepting chemotaxis protein WspA
MAQLMDATVSISSKLSVVNARANRISDVVTTMNKISDRTNVLALNAAIEAEKAGEYGRGFSVVSREISHLNDQTAVATEDISMVIGEMQSSVSTGLMEMEKFAQGVRHSTEEVGRIGDQLTALIDKVQGLEPEFKSITGGMRQQSQGAQQISEAISQLSVAADETQSSLIEFKQATETLNTATSELQTEAARFKALSGDGGYRWQAGQK